MHRRALGKIVVAACRGKWMVTAATSAAAGFA
jgi:hypothetical protein